MFWQGVLGIFVRGWVSPIIRRFGMGVVRPVRGLKVIVKCGGDVLRGYNMFDARCCAKMCVSRRCHVTCLHFETEVLSCGAVGRGVETEALGRVSTWGVVPSLG